MDNETTSTFPILTPSLQSVLNRHIDAARDFLDEALQLHAKGRLDLGDAISWANERLADFIDDRLPLSNQQAEHLADFVAACIIAVVQTRTANPDDEVHTLTAACFSLGYHRTVAKHAQVLHVIAGEVMRLYHQDEADMTDIVPLTVDRFTSYLTAKGIKVSKNFHHALTDYILLSTLHHFALTRA